MPTESLTRTNQIINCRGRLIDLNQGHAMGILNLTPDSFFDGGRYNEAEKLLQQAEKHLSEGATFLDLGAVSSRPGADDVSEEEEWQRLKPALGILTKKYPDAFISVDTWRASIATRAVEHGAALINDISGGDLDASMFETIAKLQVPYIMMHMQGTPANMQQAPSYDDVVRDVFDHLLQRAHALRSLGVHDLIIDPGFGFGKTVVHNYALLRNLENFHALNCPLLAGFSRKSMINRVLGTTPENALNGTTVLNSLALDRGASILRVHDVKQAVETIKLHGALLEKGNR